MVKKLILVSSLILLVGCNDETVENTPDSGQDIEEPVEMATDDSAGDLDDKQTDDPAKVEDSSPTSEHPLQNLVDENTFVEPYALQAWKDYQTLVEEITYGEITSLNETPVDLEGLDGSSKADVDLKFETIGLREDVYMETVNASETEFLDYYRYPAEETSDYFQTSDFLAEISLYYVDDNLMFSSITPGFYMLDVHSLPNAADLVQFLEVSDIEAINPQVYTIAEMKINGDVIRQVMIPAHNVREDGIEEMLAFYFFIQGETIVQYAYLPFETVMQRFPDYSVMVYQQLIPTITELNL